MAVEFKNEVVMAPMDSIKPNPWNPPKTDERKLIDDAKANILRVGFIGAICVRDMRNVPGWQTDWQIIDGQHRWQALLELEAVNCPIINMGEMTDDDAKIETLNFNLIHGDMEAIPVAVLVQEQYEKRGEHLAVMLAMSEQKIQDLTEMVKFDWEAFKHDPGDNDPREIYLRHVFVLTKEQDQVVNAALERMALIAGVGEESRALELIMADWLSGAEVPEGKELSKPLKRRHRIR
jgi:hypothetical protein